MLLNLQNKELNMKELPWQVNRVEDSEEYQWNMIFPALLMTNNKKIKKNKEKLKLLVDLG